MYIPWTNQPTNQPFGKNLLGMNRFMVISEIKIHSLFFQLWILNECTLFDQKKTKKNSHEKQKQKHPPAKNKKNKTQIKKLNRIVWKSDPVMAIIMNMSK